MSFFKKKGPYWCFVTIEKGKEVQHYLGKDHRVLKIIEFYNSYRRELRRMEKEGREQKKRPKRLKWKDDKGYLRRRRKKEMARSRF